MAAQVAEAKPDTIATRFVSAAVLAPMALGLVWLGGWFFAALVLVAGVLMVFEWDKLCRGSGKGVHVWLLATSVTVVCLFSVTGNFGSIPFVALGGIVLASLANRQDRPRWTALGGVYILLPIIALLWIRNDPQWGLITVIWMLIAVWATDTGAYFAGKTIGGPKLAPRFSPNKTWAGLLGGVAAASLVSVLVGRIADLGHTQNLALFGGLAAVIGQVGDISESAVKRHFGVKDSGTIIPGHGGLFDRLDSLLFVAVVVAAASLITGKAVIWQ